MKIIGKKRIKTHSYYICECPFCNKIIDIRFEHYKKRKKQDCGCQNHNDARNGKRLKLYDVHQAMKQRCLNKKQKFYHRYGGRGIKICDEWLDYKNFKQWALKNGYKDNLDLDRIDNDGNYEPSNCRWVAHKDNCNNRENTIKVELEENFYTLTQLANKYDLPRSVVSSRYTRGKRGFELVKPRQIKNSN